MKLPVLYIVNEGHVVRGVPVQAVAVHVEGDGVKQVVDWSNNLQFMFYVLSLHVAVAEWHVSTVILHPLHSAVQDS